MRVFVAVEIPKETKKEIINIQNKLPSFVGRRTTPENLHLTLKFLGEIDQNALKLIKERLKQVKLKPFEVEIKEIGFFNNYEKVIIWLALTNCSDLQRSIDISLQDLFPMEKRFMGHLTIARPKSFKNKNKFFSDLGKIKIEEIKFDVKEFKLKKSTLTSKGSIFEDLEVYSLR